MDNLKTLFNDKQYQLIVDLIKEPASGEEAFYLCHSLIQLKSYEKAIQVIKDNTQQLWKLNPITTMDTLFDLRFTLKQFDEAYADLDYFMNLPYENQEVEEKLRYTKNLIRATERQSLIADNKYDISSIKNNLLNEENDYQLLMILDYISSHEADLYIEEIKKVLIDEKRHNYVKIYAFLILVSLNLNEMIQLKKDDHSYSLNPSTCKKPFTSKQFFELGQLAMRKSNNVTIKQIFDDVIGNYQLCIYPSLVEEQNPELLVSAILSICNSYLQTPIANEKLLMSSFTLKELEKKIEEITNCLQSIARFKL